MEIILAKLSNNRIFSKLYSQFKTKLLNKKDNLYNKTFTKQQYKGTVLC